MQFERFTLARAWSRSRALLALLCAATPAFGGSRAATSPLPGASHTRFDRVLYDEPSDGALWAVGARYKASFGPDGATFIPAFGSAAPKNYPHELSPDHVTIGGVPLAVAGRAAAQRDDDRITLDRGSFVERYDLSLDEVEQSFVFEALPGAGDLVLHIPIASELVGTESDERLEFRGAYGAVTYGRAVAVDATGRRFAAPTHLVDGSIEIAVSAEDLADATLPVVVDPVVTTLDVIITTVDTRNADSAWDEFNGTWLITWSEAFSASDNDVYGRTINPNGFADSAIDVTSVSWNTPRCAELALAHQFLVVAATSGASADIWSRTLQPNGTINTLGTQTFISGGDAGAKTNPDVGGNFTGTSFFYCVVWERLDPANNKTQIATRLVSQSGFAQGTNATYLTASTPNGGASLPTVSKSSNDNEWLVAFTYNNQIPLVSVDVLGVRIGLSGTILSPAFQVSTSGGTKTQAVASSFQTNSSRAMIAYKRRAGLFGPGEYDIWVALLDGATVLSNTNLSALENSGVQTRDQGTPAIDCDGQHFLVGYLESVSSTAWNALVDDLALVGNTVSLTQQRVSFQGSALADAGLQVAAARKPSGLPSRLACVSSNTPGPGNFQLANYVLFEATKGGLVGFYCAGLGSPVDCPCGNIGSAGRGCGNSTSSEGAVLDYLSGWESSTIEDNLVLRVESLPLGAACLFFQGTTVTGPAVFGDGLMCTGGTITRLAVKFAPAGFADFPGAGDPTLTVAGGVPIDGGRRAYQVWYRDSAAFCTSATNNLSNGFFVDWAR